ncbi:MAG: glycosyltransferase 87 family protein [Calditrichota bacterium]
MLGFFLPAMELAPAFNAAAADPPYEELVALLCLSGLAYLFLVETVIHTPVQKRVVLWILALGIIMRFAAILAEPILEDDYHRYLWDGAVAANGLNPYLYSPQDVLEGKETTGSAIYSQLSNDGKDQLEKVNHAYLRTIYPPVTQFFFAAAYWLVPWNILGWKLVLLGVEILVLWILYLLIRHLALSPLWFAAYWLNPLLVKEIFNSGHMDLLLVPFLLGALLLAFTNRPQLAAVSLAIAGGVKIWPLALFPIIFRPYWKRKWTLLVATGIVSIMTVLFFWPMYATGLDTESGLNAYSQRWQLNDSLFLIIFSTAEFFFNLLDLREGFAHLYAQQTARGIVAVLCLALIAWYSFTKPGGKQEIVRRCLMVSAAIFLLSPTQFPWYVVWLIPLLTLYQRRSLFMLTALLPLYYLWHCYNVLGRADDFANWVVWVEFVPVWLVFLYEWWHNRQSITATPTEVVEGYEERFPDIGYHPRFK